MSGLETDWGHPAGGQVVRGSLEVELGQAVEKQGVQGGGRRQDQQ